MDAEQILDMLTRTYTKVFGKAPQPEPRLIEAKDQDDRQGNPTRAVEFLEWIVYETATDEKDIRGVATRKIAIDTFKGHYSFESGWDGDVVEVGLYDNLFRASAELMGLIAKQWAEAEVEAEYEDDIEPSDDMDGDAGSALASVGWGTDEDYGGAQDDGGDW